MKVQVKLTRVATYQKIVEMTEEQFNVWNHRLDDDEKQAAEDLDDELLMYRETPDYDDAELDKFEKVE